MNIRRIIFSAIMASLLAAILGLALTTISQREQRKPIYVVGGATLGFVMGGFLESIQQQKRLRPDEFAQSDQNP